MVIVAHMLHAVYGFSPTLYQHSVYDLTGYYVMDPP